MNSWQPATIRVKSLSTTAARLDLAPLDPEHMKNEIGGEAAGVAHSGRRESLSRDGGRR
jgi:hypothetical protein